MFANIKQKTERLLILSGVYGVEKVEGYTYRPGNFNENKFFFLINKCLLIAFKMS